MRNATNAALDSKMPESWIPDPVTILARLESVIAGGVNIGVVEKQSKVNEDHIHSLLEDKKRANLGIINDHQQYSSVNISLARNSLYALNVFLDAHDANRRKEALKFTNTSTSDYINGIAAEALEEKRLFHIIGGYGIGKSTTLERFAQKNPMSHETSGAVYVALVDEDRTSKQFYQRLSDAMCLNEKPMTSGRSMGQRTRNALRPGDLVIVDMANLLFAHGTWRTVEDIYNETPASLLMASNPDKGGFAKENQDELGSFLSRSRTRHIKQNTPGDGEQYAKAIGHASPGVIKEAGLIVSRAGLAGGMRTLAKAFEDAEKKAAAKGIAVDDRMLREAAKINSVFFR